MAETFASVVLAATEREVPPTTRRHQAPGWCTTEVIEIAIREALRTRAEAQQLMRSRQEPNCSVVWQTLEVTFAHAQGVMTVGINAHFKKFVTELERIIENGDQRGFYKYLKGTVGIDGTRVKERQHIKDDDCMLLRNRGNSYDRRVKGVSTPCSTRKSQSSTLPSNSVSQCGR